MNTITKDQLRFAQSSGIVDKASIHSDGNQFQVIVHTTSGQESQLVAARSKAPRTFANPANALSFLHGIGITSGEFNTKGWTPKVVESRATASHLSNDALKCIIQQAQHAAQQDMPTTSLWETGQPSVSHPMQVDVARMAERMRNP